MWWLPLFFMDWDEDEGQNEETKDLDKNKEIEDGTDKHNDIWVLVAAIIFVLIWLFSVE